MKLLSYKITKIDQVHADVTVEYIFDSGKETHTISFKNMAFNDSRPVEVEELFDTGEVDENKNPILEKRTVTKQVPFVNSKPRLDIQNADAFDRGIRDYADAYIQGKAQEEAEEKALVPSSEVNALIGKTNQA